MSWLWRLVTSSIGAKVLMAVTGLALLGFLVGHLVGNLQVFVGQDVLNTYAKWLHDHHVLIWTARTGVIAAFALHVLSSMRVTLLNQMARPVGYKMKKAVQSTFSSRNMFVTGTLVFAFVTYHLLQFTFLTTNPEYATLVDATGRKDVYTMMLLGFRNNWIAGTYILSMLLLCLHLNHAIGSSLQTLGFNHPRYFAVLRRLTLMFSVALSVGFLTIPIAIQLGYVASTGQGVQL